MHIIIGGLTKIRNIDIRNKVTKTLMVKKGTSYLDEKNYLVTGPFEGLDSDSMWYVY